MAQQLLGTPEDAFQTTRGFKGYVSKPEITELDPSYLVRGSKNILIDYANRVISRNGFTLFGAAASAGATGIKSSYEWDTSIGTQFPLRGWGSLLEFYWNGAWNTLMSGLATAVIEFTHVNNLTEYQDVLLMVKGDANMWQWSGGVSKIASSTATTATKQGVLTSKTTLAFVAGNGTTVYPTITDTMFGFVTAGFAAGDTLTVSGSVANNRNFTIASVTADTISLSMGDILTTEIAGPAITIHNGQPTWKSAHFFNSISGRAVLYKGVVYTYTGGEMTDTLTGLTTFPIAAVGDICWQSVLAIPLPAAITTPFPNFYPDLIGSQLNMVFLASTKNSMAFASKATDYTNFTLTSPRAQGDPMQLPLTNGAAKCIIPMDSDGNVLNLINKLIFGSGLDAWDSIDFHMDQTATYELARIIRYKTAIGSGLISKDAFCPVKNATVYISREPALDYLGNLEVPDGKRNVPISDPIKNDFDTYDFTNAHVKYWKRAIYIAVPRSGVVLIYDMMRGLWQPPQTIPVGRLAIINDLLYGHSSVVNESYQLFVGTNDAGVFIPQVARFAYNNGGRRDRLKNCSSMWSDGYITANARITMKQYCGFEGQDGIASMSISGGDTSITSLQNDTPLGNEPLGSEPLGGENLSSLAGLPGAGVPLLRFWQDDSVSAVDYIEQFVEYTLNTLDAQMAIVSHGTNQWDASTIGISHKK
jgi:hypothetical protein